MAAFVSWNNIPDSVLIYIYSILSDIDKLNAATTCQNWHRLFSTAILWRNRRIVFDSVTAEIKTEREIKFLDTFGHCLKKLTLTISRPSFQSCMLMSRSVECYLKSVSGCYDMHIRELVLENMHMEFHWNYILSRNRVISALCKMLRKQKVLETVFLTRARMKFADGCRVLVAMAGPKNGSSIIKTLYMEDFFQTHLLPCRHSRYIAAMSKFVSLEEIHINYRYLNADILRNIANNQSPSINKISVVLEGDVRGTEIPTVAWTEFTTRCPLANVVAYLCISKFRRNDLRTPFVRGIPLNKINMTSCGRIYGTTRRLGTLLRHLGLMYNSTLGIYSSYQFLYEAKRV